MKKLLIFLSFLAISSVASSQDEPTLKLTGKAIEGFTGEALENVGATLRDYETNDSLQAATKDGYHSGYDIAHMKRVVTLNFQVPKRPGTYLIEAYAEGYDTVYQMVEIDKVGSREISRNIPDFVFYKKSVALHEVSVTATKVKFYSRGDTIVYNADAFNLAEGSMLDALIKQLPGVEMRDKGEIYVNGKYVESLLLNGKDFFQGNKNIMLNNLGAYTVKNIEVYEKRSDLGMLLDRNMGDEQYVMDVKLKKEYMKGFIGNIEAGGGTADRYMGRLFALWYTSRSRLALVANINNLNDSRTPGENSSWQATQVPGDFRTKMVGLDYNWNSDDGNRWQFYGNTNLSHTRNDNIRSRYSTNFLPGGDTYETSFGRTLSHDMNIQTTNTFRWAPKNITMAIKQDFQYLKKDSESLTLSGTFQDETKNLTEQLLQKIYSGETSTFSDITINTSLSQMLNNGSMINARGNFGTYFKIPYLPDVFSATVQGGYKQNNYDNFNRYGIRYNQEGYYSDTYQYINNRPDKNWDVSALGSYTWVLPKVQISLNMSYQHTGITKDSYLYDLDRLEDTGIFGILPSDYLSSFNYDQTYLSHENWDSYKIYVHSSAFQIGKIAFNFYPILTFNKRNLHYQQGPQDVNAKKNSVDVEFSNTWINYHFSNSSYLKFQYERTAKMAPLNRMVDIVDTRDPLNIYLGASDLKNEVKNDLFLRWDWNGTRGKQMKHKRYSILTFSYSYMQNALTSGYSMNRETGVRTYKMFNVNGNYTLGLAETFYQAFGPKNQFDVRSFSNIRLERASDMMADENMNFRKSAVRTWNISENLTFGWKIWKHQLSLNGNIVWRDTRGKDAGFSNFTALNAQYGISGQFVLPWNFGFSTDLNLYSRSGYTESYLNTTDVVWNARLTYNVKGGHWLIMLDGFDLLHQLTNVTYNVNALGRTEVYTNVLPRYVLFHVQYKFNILPK